MSTEEPLSMVTCISLSSPIRLVRDDLERSSQHRRFQASILIFMLLNLQDRDSKTEPFAFRNLYIYSQASMKPKLGVWRKITDSKRSEKKFMLMTHTRVFWECVSLRYQTPKVSRFTSVLRRNSGKEEAYIRECSKSHAYSGVFNQSFRSSQEQGPSLFLFTYFCGR